MIKRIALIIIPFVVAAALPVSAAAQARGIGIGVAGGPAVPVGGGDFGADAGTGFHLLGSLGIGLPLLPFGVRADLIYQQMPFADDTFTSIGGTLNGTWRIGLPIPLASPYVLGGIGMTRHDDAHDGHLDPPETSFTFNAGVGVQLRLLGFGGFLEARYLNWTEGASVPITIGITF